MEMILEGIKKELVRMGMRPRQFGKMGGRKVEFISFPWIAGREIFVIVSKPNKPKSAQCVGAEEVKVAGQL